MYFVVSREIGKGQEIQFWTDDPNVIWSKKHAEKTGVRYYVLWSWCWQYFSFLTVVLDDMYHKCKNLGVSLPFVELEALSRLILRCYGQKR